MKDTKWADEVDKWLEAKQEVKRDPEETGLASSYAFLFHFTLIYMTLGLWLVILKKMRGEPFYHQYIYNRTGTYDLSCKECQKVVEKCFKNNVTEIAEDEDLLFVIRDNQTFDKHCMLITSNRLIYDLRAPQKMLTSDRVTNSIKIENVGKLKGKKNIVDTIEIRMNDEALGKLEDFKSDNLLNEFLAKVYSAYTNT